MPTARINPTTGRVEDINIIEILPPNEGEINQYYGRIGTGKTYAGTRRILRELRQGKVVYANWKIKWNGYDETTDKLKLFLGVLGLKRKFFKYPKSNLRFFEVKETFVDDLASKTDCIIHLDEGHIAFDSYKLTKMTIEERVNVLHTRHFDRTLVIYSQRPTAIHATLRGNVNRFYKCEKLFDLKLFGKRFIRFQVTEFQDLKQGETPDEERIRDPKTLEETSEYKHAIKQDKFWASSHVFNSYDSKYMRGNVPLDQSNKSELYIPKWSLIVKKLFTKF